METKTKNIIIKKILKREKLRNISRIKRLLKNPIRTTPYYFIAILAKIKPFILTFKTLWGDKIISDLPNGNTFLFYGYAEANLTNYLLKNIKEGDIFIDGGANIGFYSLLASRLVEDKGQVHSFEPTPSTYEILRKNSEPRKNININQCALFNIKTEIDFIDYGIGYNAFNSIYKRESGIKEIKGRDNKIKVSTTTIDEYCTLNNIKPTFIKLDLEGSEYFALLGAEKTLKEYKPTLSLEVAGDKEWLDNIKKTDQFLKNLSYEPFSIENNGELKKHTLRDSYKYDNLIYVFNNIK